MARSLQSQVVHCVVASFHGNDELGRKGGYGVSKHSDKANDQVNGKIYSYDTYNNRKEVAKEFCKFMKEHHPEIKQAKDLNQKHATEFIAKKSLEVSTNTLNNYRSQMKSLAENINHTFNRCNVNLDTLPMKGVSSEKVKDVSMTKNDYKALVGSYNDKLNSTGAVGAQVSWAAGLRAHEVCKLKGADIKIENGKATVHVSSGKGGRERDIVVSDPERVQTLQTIAEHYGENKVCDVKPHSLEVNISRHLKQTETEQDYKYNSVHSIRKEYAQETYDQLKEQGFSQKEAWGQVCENLGHSRDRIELMNTYIDKP